MYFIGVTNCLEIADFKLTDVSSKSQMENNGWFFDVEYHNPEEYKETCGTNNTWYGFTKNGDGKITANFTGSGTATLDYGNCRTDLYSSKVKVSLNDKPIDEASYNTPSKQITFVFSPTDVLLLAGINNGVIKLNSLTLTCQGKTFFHA